MQQRRQNAGLMALIAAPGSVEVLVAALALLAYIGTVTFGFVNDDRVQIVQNPALRHWRSALQYFQQDVWAGLGRGTATFYRPLFMLWLRLNHALFGLQPAGWHAAAVVLHAIASVLVCRLAAHLTRNRAAACAVGVLFALHPVHVESVAWVSGATDSLLTICVCGTTVCYLNFIGNGKRRWLAASVVLACLALLTKETAVMLPLLLAASLACVEGDWRRVAKSKSLLIFVALAVAYLPIRAAALHGAQPFANMTVGQMMLTWPVVSVFYLRELLLPWRLSFYHDVFAAHGVSQPLLIGALALLVAMAALFWWWARRSSRHGLIVTALVWLVLPLLPVFNLRVMTPGQLVADRYLYLPSAGFCLLLVVVALELLERYRSERAWRLGSTLVVAASLVYVFVVFTNQTAWASEVLLYKNAVEMAPRNATAARNLGVAYVDKGDLDQGIRWLERSSQLDPESPDTQFALSQAFYLKGDFSAACQYIRRALQRDPQRAQGWLLASQIALDSGNSEGALAAAQRAQQLWPQGEGYQTILGLVQLHRGDRKSAEEAFRRELALHPDYIPARVALEKLQSGKS